MKKNDIFETEIMDMTTEGSGVCRVDNMAVFVPHTAVGDRIRVRIVKVLKSYAFGIVEELLEPSADRIVPACGLSQCGGCLFQHITYDAELRVKEKAVQDAFIRLGKLSPEFLPILGAESRTRYRNKAQYPFALDKTGQPILGFFARRSHRVISVKDCLLQPELFGKIAGTVLEFVRRNSISVYNESSGKGDMRHLYLRCGQHSGEVMVCFIVRKPIRKKLMPLVEILTEQYPQIKSISMNCNPKKTNVILGDSTETLWGKDTITDTMCGNAVLPGEYHTGRAALWCGKRICTADGERTAVGFVLRRRNDRAVYGRCGVGIGWRGNCSRGCGECKGKCCESWREKCGVFLRRCRQHCRKAGGTGDCAGCDRRRSAQKGMR